MSDKKYTILSGNITVIGHFNPAILRPMFIKEEFPSWKLHEGKLLSPPAVPLIADMRYEKDNLRLFMDPNQMVVEDTKLSVIQEMRSPGIVRDYLNKLPYTPLQMIGLNLSAEAKHGSLRVIWSNVGDINRVAHLLDKVGYRLPVITLRYAFHGLKPLLFEAVLGISEVQGLRMQLKLRKIIETENTQILFNAEFQDLATNRGRIDFIADHFSDVAQNFSMLLDILSVEAT